MTEVINAEKAIALLKRLVAERGEDYQYVKPESSEFCVYVDPETGEASCAVGVIAIDYLGIPAESIAQFEGADPTRLLGDPCVSEERQFTEGALSLLDEFQAHQDQGTEYGTCLTNSINAWIEGGRPA